MSTLTPPDQLARLLVEPFPAVGPLMRVAYRELRIAATGTEEQIRALGDIRLLPRPWNPASCQTAQLRAEVWAWLDQVVVWLSTQYGWDVAYSIPGCWPRHPHLVHEIAVLADQRRTAETALDSDPLEDWHRYSLPAFTDRMTTRLKTHCDDGHQPWPATGRHTRHHADTSRNDRTTAFQPRHLGISQVSWPLGRRRLRMVDLDTGEANDL